MQLAAVRVSINAVRVGKGCTSQQTMNVNQCKAVAKDQIIFIFSGSYAPAWEQIWMP